MTTKNYSLPEETPHKVKEPIVSYGLNPCQYTLEELNERLDQAEEDVKAGRYYTTEEVRKMRPQWKLR